MKTKKSLAIIASIALFAILCSFISPMGGEGFQIYLDNKLVLEKFHKELNKPTNLQLHANDAGSQLHVKFYHCGMVGKNRSLSLKDANQRLLKQWDFSNEAGKNFAVTVPVKELIKFQQKAGEATLYLYYSSKEAANGRLLTGLVRSPRQAAATK